MRTYPPISVVRQRRKTSNSIHPRFWSFLATARPSASDYIIEGGAHSKSVEETPSRSFPFPRKTTNKKAKNYMKRLLLIALVVSGLAFVPVQRSDAQISVGIGYPGYGYGYYPYGYYRPYPYYGYYTGPSYYWYGGHRYYRHHRHHYYHYGY